MRPTFFFSISTLISRLFVEGNLCRGGGRKEENDGRVVGTKRSFKVWKSRSQVTIFLITVFVRGETGQEPQIYSARFKSYNANLVRAHNKSSNYSFTYPFLGFFLTKFLVNSLYLKISTSPLLIVLFSKFWKTKDPPKLTISYKTYYDVTNLFVPI